jgi:hypothetical protein
MFVEEKGKGKASVPPIHQWGVEDVVTWLKTSGFDEVCDRFISKSRHWLFNTNVSGYAKCIRFLGKFFLNSTLAS